MLETTLNDVTWKEDTVTLGDVGRIIESGKRVKVLSKNGEYVDVLGFVDKGPQKTYYVKLANGNEVKAAYNHLFFTSEGWKFAEDIIANETKIYCEDNTYSTVVELNHIGLRNVYDISVDHPEECYFAEGMLHHNTGKSLLATHVLAETQKKGGVGVLIDTEAAANTQFLEAIGIDTSKLLYIQTNAIEDVFAYIEKIVSTVREKNKDKLVTIVVDSIAGASSKTEISGDFEKTGWNTEKSLVISQALRKLTTWINKNNILLIFTNQLRMKLNAGLWEDPYCVDPYTTKIKVRYKL